MKKGAKKKKTSEMWGEMKEGEGLWTNSTRKKVQ